MAQDVTDHIKVAHTTDGGNYVVEIMHERRKQLNLGENAVKKPNGVRIFLRADENDGGILEEHHVREHLFNRIPIPKFEQRFLNAAAQMIKLADLYEERRK